MASFAMFDIREDVCIAVGGFRHGQVVEDGERRRFTVIGVHQCVGDGAVSLWFEPHGRAGAGTFDAEDLRSLRATGMAAVHEAIPVGRLVKLALEMEDGPLRQDDVTVLLEDDASSCPYRVRHRGVDWWYSASALTLVENRAIPSCAPESKAEKARTSPAEV